jgi:ABC-type sugar transport system ATPase subunit
MLKTAPSKLSLLPSNSANTALLALEDISKRFRGVTALSRITFNISPGEVITLLGSNGAGKSTLLNILSGLLQPDAGELRIEGLLARLRSPKEATKHGIRLVTQEPELFDDLSLLENVSLSLRQSSFRSVRPILRHLRSVLPQLLADTDPTITIDSDIRTLSLSQRQVLVLLSAIVAQPRLLLLDEPTASLSEEESIPVISAIRRAISNGAAVVFATHRLDLVNALARRVLVLRDGSLIEDVSVTEQNKDRIRAHITPKFTRHVDPADKPSSRPVIEVDSRKIGSRTNIPFVIHEGESLGLSGSPLWQLSVLLRHLAGISIDRCLDSPNDKHAQTFCSPQEAIASGVAYVTSDRRHEGIFADLSIAENLLMALLAQRASFSIVSRRSLTEQARAISSTLPFTSSDLWKPAVTLSGGNQQKVILSRLLAVEPRVLILDNSTRGLDTPGRTDLAKTLASYCSAGGACLVSASERDYLLLITHRIIDVYLTNTQATLG